MGSLAARPCIERQLYCKTVSFRVWSAVAMGTVLVVPMVAGRELSGKVQLALVQPPSDVKGGSVGRDPQSSSHDQLKKPSLTAATWTKDARVFAVASKGLSDGIGKFVKSTATVTINFLCLKTARR